MRQRELKVFFLKNRTIILITTVSPQCKKLSGTSKEFVGEILETPAMPVCLFNLLLLSQSAAHFTYEAEVYTLHRSPFTFVFQTEHFIEYHAHLKMH